MKTVNKIVLVIDTILGITLLAFILMEKFPEYFKIFTAISSALAAGIGIGNSFLVNEGNKKRRVVLWLLMGAFATFAGMVVIAQSFVINYMAYWGIICVMASLFISAIAYNIGNFAEKRKVKKSIQDKANK